MSRSSMSIFFSWLSVMLCTNIALNTGDLKRRIIFSASNLIICSQSLSCPTWHRGWLCDRTARPPHIWWSRHWRFPSPTGNWNPMKVSRNKSCHWTWVSSEHKDWIKCPAHSILATAQLTPVAAWPDCCTSFPSMVISHRTVSLSSGVIWLFWGSSRSKLSKQTVDFMQASNILLTCVE